MQQLSNNIRLIPTSTVEHISCYERFSVLSLCYNKISFVE